MKPRRRLGTVSVSYPNFLDWRAQSRRFSEMAAAYGVGFNLAGIAQPENIRGQAVSPNFLSMMGVRPLLGRDFEQSEEKAGAAPVVLLSYPLWQSKFGGESSASDARSLSMAVASPSSACFLLAFVPWTKSM